MTKERHILALSGGKDSAALAVYMRDKYPNLELEYVFIDSGCELPETYDYLDRIQGVLNIDVAVIRPEKSWDEHWSYNKVKKTQHGYFTFLPTPANRWCTEHLKIKPYDKWLLDNYPKHIIHSYVGLRADEKDRKGIKFSPSKIHVIPSYPFIEDGLVYQDVEHLLMKSGLGFPDYYHWRSRSGCYFCFYQTKKEWLGLYEHHPDLFAKAKSYEAVTPDKDVNFTWCDDMSLEELISNKKKILAQNPKSIDKSKNIKKLSDIFAGKDWQIRRIV